MQNFKSKPPNKLSASPSLSLSFFSFILPFSPTPWVFPPNKVLALFLSPFFLPRLLPRILLLIISNRKTSRVLNKVL
ncbi:hypothetical protein QBC44DRAFT_88623 [Cladorrhinum sp. PSN332]|nr:hypothetical protein QBC44DRAFT_88623 [Cladorrhinum sp. PSN332]